MWQRKMDCMIALLIRVLHEWMLNVETHGVCYSELQSVTHTTYVTEWTGRTQRTRRTTSTPLQSRTKIRIFNDVILMYGTILPSLSVVRMTIQL